jgi:hypothetical protein
VKRKTGLQQAEIFIFALRVAFQEFYFLMANEFINESFSNKGIKY